MKTWKIVVGTVLVLAVMAVLGMGVLSALAQGPWGNGMMNGWPRGYGMMGGGWPGGSSNWSQGGWCGGYGSAGQGQVTSLEQAQGAVESYVQDLGYTGLQVKEVMEFERNYYAIVEEEDTGIGAMEVLVNKDSGAVSPEPGPNMMWNARYGMMGGRGMMGRYFSGEMTVTPAEAEQAAQKWLDANFPGTTAGDADAFYGYYTFHFLKDGAVAGMLSVHGATGAVWYHSWHGSFVAMIGE